ncbi:MAG: hypothetical protein GXP27_04550 [Planctomycetes bacterium]|nr:hypothetical protein [Planctomycetota bacterium]
MKSQHRHELQTNDLSKLLAKASKWYEQHGSKLTWAVVGVLAIVLIGTYWSRSSRAERAAAWSAFVRCRSPEDFANLAEDYDGTEIAAWARLRAAESQLQQGTVLMFTDRAAGKSELKAAEATFSALLGDETTPSMVRERALIGLAQVRESLADGNLQPAIELYERFVREFPDSVLKEMAQRRIESLKTGGAQAFYAWFAKQNPKPEDLEKPKDLAGEGTGTTSTSGKTIDKAAGSELMFPEPPKEGATAKGDAQTKSDVEPKKAVQPRADANPNASATKATAPAQKRPVSEQPADSKPQPRSQPQQKPAKK